MFFHHKKLLKSIKESKDFIDFLANNATKTETEKKLFEHAKTALKIAVEVLQNAIEQEKL